MYQACNLQTPQHTRYLSFGVYVHKLYKMYRCAGKHMSLTSALSPPHTASALSRARPHPVRALPPLLLSLASLVIYGLDLRPPLRALLVVFRCGPLLSSILVSYWWQRRRSRVQSAPASVALVGLMSLGASALLSCERLRLPLGLWAWRE